MTFVPLLEGMETNKAFLGKWLAGFSIDHRKTKSKQANTANQNKVNTCKLNVLLY